MADFSTTAYGVVDGRFQFQSVNGVASDGLVSGAMAGNRFGLKGAVTDQGEVRDFYVLESGFDLNNGQLKPGGRVFAYQMCVPSVTRSVSVASPPRYLWF